MIIQSGYKGKSGIYKIKNKKTNQLYIGSAIDLFQRGKRHLSNLKRKKHNNSKLQTAYNKYGKNTFSFILITAVTNKKDLVKVEQKYIDRLQPAYNIRKVVTQTKLGFKHSEKSKQQMSDNRKGQPAWNKGKKMRKA